jgi:hypothetical protein
MKKRRAFFFGGPVGASLLIALIPGPCTTFDDATPPGADASIDLDSAPIVDAAPYVPRCGLTLIFAADAQDCQNLFDNGYQAGAQNCCKEERACAESGPCADWVACANDACAPGLGDSSCAFAAGCGSMSSFRDAAEDLASCKFLINKDPSFCRWP